MLSGDNYIQGDKRTGEPELGLIEFQIGPGKNLNHIIHCNSTLPNLNNLGWRLIVTSHSNGNMVFFSVSETSNPDRSLLFTGTPIIGVGVKEAIIPGK